MAIVIYRAILRVSAITISATIDRRRASVGRDAAASWLLGDEADTPRRERRGWTPRARHVDVDDVPTTAPAGGSNGARR